MQFSVLLALSAAASLAQANIQGPALLRRHMEAFSARATPISDSSDSPAGDLGALPTQCISEAISIASSIPSPPPALLSEVEESHPTNICDFSVPASLSAEFSTYAQEIGSWSNAHMTELLDFVKSCGDNGVDYTSLLGECTAALGGDKPAPTQSSGIQSASATPTAQGSSVSTPSPSSGSSGSNSTKPIITNAAATTQTGVSALFLAAVGIVVLAL